MVAVVVTSVTCDGARQRATPRLALKAARTGLVVAVIVVSATCIFDAAASCGKSTGATRSAVQAAISAGEAYWATYQAQTRQLYVTKCSV